MYRQNKGKDAWSTTYKEEEGGVADINGHYPVHPWNMEKENAFLLHPGHQKSSSLMTRYCCACLICISFYKGLPDVLGKHDIISGGKENQMFSNYFTLNNLRWC